MTQRKRKQKKHLQTPKVEVNSDQTQSVNSVVQTGLINSVQTEADSDQAQSIINSIQTQVDSDQSQSIIDSIQTEINSIQTEIDSAQTKSVNYVQTQLDSIQTQLDSIQFQSLNSAQAKSVDSIKVEADSINKNLINFCNSYEEEKKKAQRNSFYQKTSLKLFKISSASVFLDWYFNPKKYFDEECKYIGNSVTMIIYSLTASLGLITLKIHHNIRSNFLNQIKYFQKNKDLEDKSKNLWEKIIKLKNKIEQRQKTLDEKAEILKAEQETRSFDFAAECNYDETRRLEEERQIRIQKTREEKQKNQISTSTN